MVASRTLPTGPLTFVFTDIEGSTRLVETLGVERWAALLGRHRELIRAAVADEDGVEVATEGDGFFLVFRSPEGAVRALAAAQRALTSEPWPDGAPIRVRAGVHTGEGTLDHDGGYLGHDVHRAARVAAAGHGGQVLLSGPAAALVADRLPPGVALRSLGPHRLKDLRPEPLAQLVIEGLRSDFPRLRTLDALPNNLPVPATSFVGRERELAEAAQLLGAARLLTLTGPGGTGKTRLALQLAATVADRFPDGVTFVPLASVRDARLVPNAVGNAVHVPEQPGRDAVDTLAMALEGRRCLLVLDNLEQVLDAAPFVSDLVTALPELRIIATSRAPLRIGAEQELPILPLPVPSDPATVGRLAWLNLPEAERRRDAEAVLRYEGVRLFVERARHARPSFQLHDGNADDIAGIVSHLSGMPLAIELAAARIRLLSPAEIRERIGRELDMPGSGMRDLPERQRTLRATIDWSWALLDPACRSLLARLAVFEGGADLECIETVAGPAADLGIEVVDGLEQLVDQSLVRLSPTGDETRYVLLEPIREFALEQFEGGGSAARIRERHASAYLALVERVEARLSGAEQRRWLDRLDREHANVRAALEWAMARPAPETAMRLAAATWRYWQKRGHLREARRRLDTLLAQPWATEAYLRAAVLEAAGGVAYWHGDMSAARGHYAAALELERQLGDRAAIANALYNESFAYLMAEDVPPEERQHGEDDIEEALRIYTELGEDEGMADALWGKGIHLKFAGQAEAAQPFFERALDGYRRVGNRTQEAWSLEQLGSTDLRLGHTDRGRERLGAALRLFDAAGDLAGVTIAMDGLSAAAVAEGDLVRAARLHGLARRLQQTSGTDLARYVEERFEEATRGSARLAMAPEDLERHASEGRAMTLADGIAYALGETGEGPAPDDAIATATAAAGSEGAAAGETAAAVEAVAAGSEGSRKADAPAETRLAARKDGR
jgi:predicted ATPase/class 3 adenylate cyclase